MSIELCGCGTELLEPAELHFSRCNKHILIYAPSEEERDINDAIRKQYKADCKAYILEDCTGIDSPESYPASAWK